VLTSPGEHGPEDSGPPDHGPALGRLILLVTSPRVAPGLLTLAAWDTLRDAARVFCGSADHPQLPALAAAGIGYDIVDVPPPPLTSARADITGSGSGAREAYRQLARLLADAAAEAEGPVVWLVGDSGPGRPGAGDRADDLESALSELPGNTPATAVIYGSADMPGARLLDLVTTMEILRTECPWDAKQTHESLAPHLLEEPYEALEALESGDHDALREELGDVLLQVVFHAKVASERRDGTGYTVDDIADGIVAKLVRRHPHVFADVAVSGAEEVKQNWDAIKKAERARKASPGDAPSSALDGVPFGQPALALAAQLQRRAERAGVPEEFLGVAQADGHPMPDAGEDPAAPDAAARIGDSLFALVAVARAAGLDSEMELRSAARRFGEWVRAWEQARSESLPRRPADKLAARRPLRLIAAQAE
jgi:XTP/dITP diphosphohydrolase